MVAVVQSRVRRSRLHPQGVAPVALRYRLDPFRGLISPVVGRRPRIVACRPGRCVRPSLRFVGTRGVAFWVVPLW